MINLFIAIAIAGLIYYWMKVCFLKPPKFGRFTARNFFKQTFRIIADGNKEELLALAQELMREIPRIVARCPIRQRRVSHDESESSITDVEALAHDLLFLLSDSRFCNLVAEELPTFPAYLVEQTVQFRQFDIPAPLIIRKMVIALLSNRKSALFVENEWLSQGYIGQVKPITKSIFFNWSKIEKLERGVDSPLDMQYPYAQTWDRDTWRVYFGAALQYLNGLVEEELYQQMPSGLRYIFKTTKVAYRAIGYQAEFSDPIDPRNPYWHAKEANNFLAELVNTLSPFDDLVFFIRKDEYHYGHDIASEIASISMDAIFAASEVNTTDFRMWDIQHNLVWSPIEWRTARDTQITRMSRRKLRRMIWEEIKQMNSLPNYRGARCIRFCLNVLDFYDESIHRRHVLKDDSWPLTKVVSNWVRKNYQDLVVTHPPIAEAILPAGIEYDQEEQVLIRTSDNIFNNTKNIRKFYVEPTSKIN